MKLDRYREERASLCLRTGSCEAIALLRLIISGNRETTPMYLSGYLSFIVKFAFLFPFTKMYWLHPRGLRLPVRALIFFGEKQLQKALGGRGRVAEETNKFFLGVGGGRGRIKEHFLQFLKFCHSSLCYGFTNFKLLVFLDHLKYGYFPNMGYFNSSVLTSLSKEEAVFSKL